MLRSGIVLHRLHDWQALAQRSAYPVLLLNWDSRRGSNFCYWIVEAFTSQTRAAWERC